MTNPATHDAPQIVKHWTESEPVRLAGHRAGRVYLAGPMTGLPEFNFPAFNAEAAILRAQGLTVINPAEHGIVEGAEWADYLRHDIAGLASCERIHLLRGWENSKGARLEVHIAQQLGMVITRQEGATLQAQPAEVSDAGAPFGMLRTTCPYCEQGFAFDRPEVDASDELVDQHLDAILRAAGSALRHYTMQKSKDDMRSALRRAILALRPQAVPVGRAVEVDGEIRLIPYDDAPATSPLSDGSEVFCAPLNLNCKSVQKRLMAQWGYEVQPAREPPGITAPAGGEVDRG